MARKMSGFFDDGATWSNNSHEKDDYWDSDKSRSYNMFDSDETKSMPSARFRPGQQNSVPSPVTCVNIPMRDDNALILDMEKLKKCSHANIEGVKQKCSNCDFEIRATDFRCEGDKMFCTENCWQKAIKTFVDSWSSNSTSSCLESFKSKDSLALIVKQTTELRNPAMLLKVLLHVKSVFSNSSFLEILIDRNLRNEPVSMNHYVSYLKQIGLNDKAATILSNLGFVPDGKMILHKELMSKVGESSSRNAKYCCRLLDEFAKDHLSNDPQLSLQFEMVSDHVALLNEQINLQEMYFQDGSQQLSESRRRLLPDSIINLSLSETIHCLVIIHGSGGPKSPADQLKTRFQMSESHYRWVVVEPLTLLQKWKDLQTATHNQKWLSRKVETHIPTERLVLFLYSLEVPFEILNEYTSLISDIDNLVKIAVRLKLYKIAVHAIVKQKDVNALKDLASQVPQTTQEWHVIQNLLNKPSHKW